MHVFFFWLEIKIIIIVFVLMTIYPIPISSLTPICFLIFASVIITL